MKVGPGLAGHDAITVFEALEPVTYVCLTRYRIEESSLPVWSVFFEIANVDRSTLEHLTALSMSHVLAPFSFIELDDPVR